MDERPTIGALLDHLREEGLIGDGDRPKIEAELAEDRGVPWYLQALMAVGAWFAAIFFVVFFGAAGVLGFHDNAWIPLGLILIAGATALRRIKDWLFLQQFCLAVSLAGHVMAMIGAANVAHGHEVRAVAAMTAALCVALYALYTDPLHRFLSVVNAIGWAVAQVLEMKEPHAIHGIVFAQVVGLLAIFTRRHVMTSLLPLGYALAVMLPGSLILTALPDMKVGTIDAPSRAVLTGAVLWVIIWAAGGRMKREAIVVALVAAGLVGIVGVAGLIAGVLLLVIGYARWDQRLLGLGAASLVLFLIVYFYALSVPLEQKAPALIASGGVMLGAAAYVRRRFMSAGAALKPPADP